MCILRGEAELWYVVFKKNKTKLFFLSPKQPSCLKPSSTIIEMAYFVALQGCG